MTFVEWTSHTVLYGMSTQFVLQTSSLVPPLRLDHRNGLIESQEAAEALQEGPDDPLPPHEALWWRPVFTQTRLDHMDRLDAVHYPY